MLGNINLTIEYCDKDFDGINIGNINTNKGDISYTIPKVDFARMHIAIFCGKIDVAIF